MRQPSFGCRSDYVREHLYCRGASPPVARTWAGALFANGGFPAVAPPTRAGATEPSPAEKGDYK